MYTPQEIAQLELSARLGENDTPDRFDQTDLAEFAVAAIIADRAQRDLVQVVADALDDRGAHAAAGLVRGTDPDDDLWNCYLGPMLDQLQTDYTHMAHETQRGTE